MPAGIMRAWTRLDPAGRKWLKVLLGVVIGGAGGFAYYAFVGCSTGSCPLTSNPIVASALGATIGGFTAHG
jgi:hypothetical protein